MKRTVRRRGDKEYTYLSFVEAVRVEGKNRQVELLRLGEVGELERSGQLDRIIEALTKHAKSEWLEASSLEGAGAPSFGSVAAVATYFSRIGLRDHFGHVGDQRGSVNLADTVFVMVANRLCDPASKRRTICRWAETIELPCDMELPSLDRCYRALDAVCDVKKETEKALYARLTDVVSPVSSVALSVASCSNSAESLPWTSITLRAFPSSVDSRSLSRRSRAISLSRGSAAGRRGDRGPHGPRRRLGGATR